MTRSTIEAVAGRHMNTRRLVGVALGTLAIGDWRMTAQNPVTASAELRITVYDQAHLPREVARSAFDRLRIVLRQSGIAVELVAGDLAADEASLFTYISVPKGHEQEAACRARRDIALKINDISPGGVAETVLGIAAPLALTGLNARVYNQHIREAAFRHNRPYAVVLAYAIAHEIGHVLLRSSVHEQWGLMSSVWREREFAQMADAPVMFFTLDESKRMLMNLRGMGCRNVVLARPPGSTPPVFGLSGSLRGGSGRFAVHSETDALPKIAATAGATGRSRSCGVSAT